MQMRLGYGPLITGCGGEPWSIKKRGGGTMRGHRKKLGPEIQGVGLNN